MDKSHDIENHVKELDQRVIVLEDALPTRSRNVSKDLSKSNKPSSK